MQALGLQPDVVTYGPAEQLQHLENEPLMYNTVDDQSYNALPKNVHVWHDGCLLC